MLVQLIFAVFGSYLRRGGRTGSINNSSTPDNIIYRLIRHAPKDSRQTAAATATDSFGSQSGGGNASSTQYYFGIKHRAVRRPAVLPQSKVSQICWPQGPGALLK